MVSTDGPGYHGCELEGMSERPAPVVPRLLGPHAPVELYWLPLGAGGHSVRFNGRVFEAISAGLQRRLRRDLYHAALEVHLPEGRFVIEMTPVPRDAGDAEARAVATGSVGSRLVGRLRLFRYEIRCWRDGAIPDLAEAVDSPRAVCVRAEQARWLLRLVPLVPTPVWGRDELAAGEMWNSNSVVSWLLERGGIEVDAVVPPPNGRAPGWDAGVVVARRDQSTGDCADSSLSLR